MVSDYDKLRMPRSGDFIRVVEGTFPDYPYCVFAVTGFIDSEIFQICVRPAWTDQLANTVWIHYQSEVHILITDTKEKEMLETLYGPARYKNR